MKIALVHDDLIQYGGAEKLLMGLSEIWPQAPIYTSIYDPKLVKADKRFKNCDIRTSWMQKLPFKNCLRRVYFPLYPAAFESFDFSEFDVVISSSTRFAHGIITKPSTIHICYCNSPARFLWETERYLEGELRANFAKLALSPILFYLRIWDTAAASRPDFFIANSKNVAAKIKKYYKRDSIVIYPFVDLGRFKPKSYQSSAKAKPYFLIVSRLLAYKRIDLAIEVANQLKLLLQIVGAGPNGKKLKSQAGPTIVFLGQISTDKLIKLYQNCQAVIVTSEEDFGLVSLEAAASGKPVIAYGAGGSAETIIDGKTGLKFWQQTPESLIEGIKRLKDTEIKWADCRKNALNFSKKKFQTQLKDFVNGHVKSKS